MTSYEARRGERYFAARRNRLDQTVAQIEFIFQHVDFGAFIREGVRRLLGQLSHFIVHLSLQIVRAAERVLTRLVRYLRSKHSEDTAPGENVREFVKTLSDFKGQLNATHPEVSDVQHNRE